MFRRLEAVSVAIMLLAAPAAAQTAGDPVQGRRIAEQSCMECHGASVLPRKAPTFEAIAAMPSTTELAVTVFLRTSHPTMPNLILSPAEQADVAAWILSLRK